MSCSCNQYIEIVSGGLSAGGSASYEFIKYIEGGSKLGGSARVDIASEVFDGFVFALPLDESGGPYLDRTRNSFDGVAGGGTYTPALASGVSCESSNYFDGDSYISLPQDNHSAIQPFTISMWIKLENKFEERVFYTRGISSNSTNMTFTIGHSYINHLFARIVVDDSGTNKEYAAYSSELLVQDRWYQIACSWTPTDSMKVYINGTLGGSTDVPERSMVALTNGGYVGRLKTGRTFTGNLQDLRLHPSARSSEWLTMEHSIMCDANFVEVGSTDEAVFE